MPWPLSQDYNEAIQSPASSLGDPELQGGEPVTSALGMPMPRSGNFADVYEFVGASGAKWAIKCFTRAVPGLRERYTEISKHLVQAKLPFTVDFEFLARGIRIRGDWYPVLKMQWVEGFLLNEFVRNNLDKSANLTALADLWGQLAQRLRRANLAHGDLQHGNVLLVPWPDEQHLALKLIDYDGMYLPALAGIPSGEVGHPAYQHPQRLRDGTYNAQMDRFPLLVIYVAIRALTAGGRPLWDRYDNGDNLLFRRQDLEAPSKSVLFAELLKMDDQSIRMLAAKLIDAARQPLAENPLLDDLISSERGSADTGDRWWTEPGVGKALAEAANSGRAEIETPVATLLPPPTMVAVPAAIAAQKNLDPTFATPSLPKPNQNAKAGRQPMLIWALAAASAVVAVAFGALLVAILVMAFREGEKTHLGQPDPVKHGPKVVPPAPDDKNGDDKNADLPLAPGSNLGLAKPMGPDPPGVVVKADGRLIGIAEAKQPGVPQLIKALYDPNPEMRRAAASALGRIGVKAAAVPALKWNW